jgi:hypothetical protein
MDTIPLKCLICIEEILNIRYNTSLEDSIKRQYFASEHFRMIFEIALKEACKKIYEVVPKDDYSI